MMKNVDKMGVFVLLAHLVITLVVLLVYGYTLFSGEGDVTLQTILTIIIGYWFGSMGNTAIRPNAGTQIQANQVKVISDEANKQENKEEGDF